METLNSGTYDAGEQSLAPGRVPGMVSILIVNWNGLRFLEACLGSIERLVSVPHEVVFVDNGSEDGSLAYVERTHPRVRIVRSEENLGFLRGTNRAAQLARGEFLLLLNNDTVLQTDIAPAVQLLQRNPRAGAVGAGMYSGAGQLLPNCGSFPSLPRLLLFKSLFWSPYRGLFGPPELGGQRVHWVEGSWLLTPAAVWEKAGGLDPKQHMYGEDLHYCRELDRLGLAAVHMPALRYTHFVGFSLKRQPYLYATFRYFHAKDSGPLKRWAADVILKAGLWFRVAAYGALALATRRPVYRERYRFMKRALELWDKTAVPGFNFHELTL